MVKLTLIGNCKGRYHFVRILNQEKIFAKPPQTQVSTQRLDINFFKENTEITSKYCLQNVLSNDASAPQ